MDAVLQVVEIYASIQGESSFAGWPCVLVRLAGCPWQCTYCDTEYARNETGETLRLPEILSAVAAHGLHLVEVTGGEPLAQAAAPVLITALLDAGYEVLVETGGSVSIEGLDSRARIILDVKTPASGVCELQDWGNLKRLKPGDEVKFVLCSRVDYDWAVALLKETDLAARQTVHFSPAETSSTQISRRALAEWILADRLPVHLNLQLHRWIWGLARRR